jgi:alkanesulfonate monooxygenase SsuD/methylene tetrahydromethanopterin reductase-like flavin-dependent oxidoreductase (luciferase family)
VKFGYFTLTDNPATYGSRRRDANQLLLDTLDEALAAERLGFNSVWLPEHHFGGFGVLPTPATFLAYVAARTERVKLSAATVLLPCNQPLRAAEEFAMLDLLSNGRAIFSAGRGYDEREYKAFEIPFAESRTRFDEELEIVRKAWTEEEWSFQGQHHTIPGPITVYPRPVQQPHMPVYIACFSEPTMRTAAEMGFNIIFAPFAAAMMFGSLQQAVEKFRSYAREAGHAEAKAMCSYFVCLAHTTEQERQARERLLMYLRAVSPAFPGDRSKAPPHIAYFADIVDRIHAMEPSDLGERSIVTGTPTRVIDHLHQVEDAGIEEVICYFSYGALPHGEVLQQMERFSAEVMPAFVDGRVWAGTATAAVSS